MQEGAIQTRHPAPWREGKLIPELLEVFLQNLRACGVLTVAARSIGVERTCIYKKMETDPEFKEAVNDARQEYYDKLRKEYHDRAFEGTEEVVVYQGQIMKDDDGKPLKVRKINDQVLMRLADAVLPEFNRKKNTGAVGNMTVNIHMDGQGKHDVTIETDGEIEYEDDEE